MCGIYGFIGLIDKERLASMGKFMTHRGPDQIGHYFSENASLGMNRLKIIDPTDIELPLKNETSSLILTFNGEIYNYPELKKDLVKKGHIFTTETDFEVILHLYEEYGEKLLLRLNGMFAFALYDKKQEKLIIARDRLGIKPLFYSQIGSKLFFSSEVKPLITKAQVNTASMARFLGFRYNFGRDTLFQGISKLEAGSYATFQKGGLDIIRYWGINSQEIKNPKEELDKLMHDSIKLRLQSDVNWGVFLSGGIDSSAIAYYVKQNVENLTTFSMDCEENKNAGLVADFLGTKHFSFRYDKTSISLLPEIISRFGEPLADPIAIPTFLLAKEAKKHVTMVLSGEGADEVFGGYEQYKIMKNALAINKHLPDPVKLLGAQGLRILPENAKEFFLSLESPEEAYKILVSQFSKKQLKKLGISLPEIKPLFVGKSTDMQYFDLTRFLPEDNLFRLDHMLMANKMEGRVPFLDHRIVEFGFSLPAQERQDKKILRDLMVGRLPKQITQAKKKRWIFPTNDWFPFDAFKRIFEDKDLLQFFNIEELKKITNYKKSIKYQLLKLNTLTRLYYSRQLWNLLCFGIWYKQFIKNEEVAF